MSSICLSRAACPCFSVSSPDTDCPSCIGEAWPVEELMIRRWGEEKMVAFAGLPPCWVERAMSLYRGQSSWLVDFSSLLSAQVQVPFPHLDSFNSRDCGIPAFLLLLALSWSSLSYPIGRCHLFPAETKTSNGVNLLQNSQGLSGPSYEYELGSQAVGIKILSAPSPAVTPGKLHYFSKPHSPHARNEHNKGRSVVTCHEDT